MFHKGIQGIPYYLGIRSLAEIATPQDRVCVLNIAGGESRQVTPTSHAFSGGNVVFGTSPGRAGQVLKTPAGDIPIFNNVREGLDAGHAFNTGVVYGLKTLWTGFRLVLHRNGILKSRKFRR